MSRNFAAVVKKILDDDSRAGILGTPVETCDSGQPGFAVVTNLHPGEYRALGRALRHRGAAFEGLCLPIAHAACHLEPHARHVAAPVRPASRRDRGGAVASARVVEARSGSGRTRAGGAGRHVDLPPIRSVPRARGLSLTMWRAAKRAAAAALRDAGRGVAPRPPRVRPRRRAPPPPSASRRRPPVDISSAGDPQTPRAWSSCDTSGSSRPPRPPEDAREATTPPPPPWA